MNRLSIIYSFALLLFLACLPVLADDSGQFTELSGEVSIQKTSDEIQKAELGTTVVKGDKVTTADDAKATILFENGSVLRLGPSTIMQITQLAQNEDDDAEEAAYDLAMGVMMPIVGPEFKKSGALFKVKTPSASARAIGTIFILEVTKDKRTGKIKTTAAGIEGQVEFKGDKGSARIIGPNKFSSSSENGFAAPPVEIEPEYLDGLMNKVKIQQDKLKVDPIRNFRKEKVYESGFRNVSIIVPETLIQANMPAPPPPPQQGGPHPGAGQFLAGDNPAGLIYEEPPHGPDVLTELQLIVNFEP